MQQPTTPSTAPDESRPDAIEAGVRGVLADHARLSVPVDALDGHDELVGAGLTSHASVTVMLALEDAFDVEFTPDLLTKATFASIDSIAAALRRLGVDATGPAS
jgi:acyl carrier protein